MSARQEPARAGAERAASTSAMQAYRQIRSAILAGRFEPGQFVPEEEFAQLCGMSRTPVREAIARLVSELLLQRTDTKRLFVPSWSDDEIEELFALRAGLEAHCARRTASLITPAEIEELRGHAARIDAAIADPQAIDVPAFVEGNRLFHAAMMAAARSDRLAQLMRLVVSQVIVHRTAERYTHEDMVRSQADHLDLIRAFAAHDGEWAAAIAANHIRRAANAYRAHQAAAPAAC